MNRLIQRLQLFVFAVFLIVLGAIVYQRFFILGPYEHCDKIGSWWDPKDHMCARVLYVPNITHRYVDPKKVPEITARKTVAGKPVGK